MAGWQDAPLVEAPRAGRVQVTIRPPGADPPADGAPAAWQGAPAMETDADQPMRARVGDAFEMGPNDAGLAGRLRRAGRRGVDPAADIATAEARPAREAMGWGGRLDAVARGIANVPSFGLADEFAAAMDAVTHPMFGRGAPGESFGARYNRNLSRERGIDRADEIDRPVERIGGQIAGAIAVPIGAGVTTVRGAAGIGGALGAGQGFGEGEGGLGNRLLSAGGGGLVGGVVGAGVVPLVRGVGRAAEVGQGLGGRLMSVVRGIRNPEEEAVRRAAGTISRDAAAAGRQAGDLLDDVARMQAAGQPAVLADAGGEATRGLARSAANTSPEARQTIRDVVEPRFAGQTQRIVDEIARVSPTGGAVHETRDALRQAARVANRDAYGVAYRAGALPLNTPELARLTQSPAVQAAMRDAAENGLNRAIADGFETTAGAAARNAGLLGRVRAYDPEVRNLQFWDYTYRALRDAGDAATRAGRGSEGSALTGLANQLRAELDQIVPQFASARAGAAAAFGARDALEAGAQFVTSRMANAEARAAYTAMSAPERDLFRQGFTENIIARVREVGDRREVVNQVFGSPAARERVELALGRGPARELEAFLRGENTMDLLRRAMGNSTTAQQLTELGMAGGPLPTTLGTLFVRVVNEGRHAIDGRVAERVGRLLASGDVGQVRRAVTMIGRDRRLLDVVREAESRMARIAGTQSGGAGGQLPGAVGAVMPSRGEEAPPDGELPRQQ